MFWNFYAFLLFLNKHHAIIDMAAIAKVTSNPGTPGVVIGDVIGDGDAAGVGEGVTAGEKVGTGVCVGIGVAVEVPNFSFHAFIPPSML